MAAATSEHHLTLEFHGFLAERMAACPGSKRRGTRILVTVPLDRREPVASVLNRLVGADARYALLFDTVAQSLPEHVEVVLNDRVLDLQGGLAAVLKPGDVLTFIPAHAGGT
jgi:molybdopterin converting factor small subunit